MVYETKNSYNSVNKLTKKNQYLKSILEKIRREFSSLVKLIKIIIKLIAYFIVNIKSVIT